MPATDRPPIRLLEPESNARGDMFTRLASDLFMALGYEIVHANLPRTGREIDLIATHRTEPRRAVAE
jgi:Holliday junction resolvase-like predicted endonuclease